MGAENFFIFGLTAIEVEEKRRSRFSGRDAVKASSLLGDVLDSVASGMFSPDEPDRFRVLVDELLNYDHLWLQPTSMLIGTLSAPSMPCGINPICGGVRASRTPHEWVVLVGPHRPRVRGRNLGLERLKSSRSSRFCPLSTDALSSANTEEIHPVPSQTFSA